MSPSLKQNACPLQSNVRAGQNHLVNAVKTPASEMVKDSVKMEQLTPNLLISPRILPQHPEF